MTEKMIQLGFKETELKSLNINPFEKIGDRWMLITAGNENGYNTMTASWGGFGVMWGKPVATAVIRPQRYTKEFVDNSDVFTLSFYPEDKKPALAFCGANSGRDMQPGKKAEKAGLTPLFTDGTAAFEEASMIFICKKLFAAAIKEEDFLDKQLVDKWYSAKDFHIAYTAEITACYVKE